MISLLAATLCFLALHLGVSGSPARRWIVAGIGENAYRGLFSLASLAAVVWMVLAYGRADRIVLWPLGAGTLHLVFLLMAVAVYLVVAGLTTPNPTAAGADRLLERPAPAQGIIKVTRHPFLWGVALWALAHLIANGDVASLVFFGGFGLLALIGPRLIDAKLAAKRGEAWQHFAAETSWLPFRALVERRTRLELHELGWWRPALAAVLYLAILLFLHGWLIGVPLLPL